MWFVVVVCGGGDGGFGICDDLVCCVVEIFVGFG